MKAKFLYLSIVVLSCLSVSLQSCSKEDEKVFLSLPNAVVTIRPQADESFVMQLDDENQLIADNIAKSPFGKKEVRALVNYTENGAPQGKVQHVTVNWLDSIRTKMPVPDMGDMNNINYGNDPIEIVNDWVTVAEDGYITMRIRTFWGTPGSKHYINLVYKNSTDPLELELRHDARGETNGRWGDALIAFNLNELTQIEGNETRIILKWHSYSGDKSSEFSLKLRPDRLVTGDRPQFTSSVE